MKTEMSAAQILVRLEDGLSLANPTHACSGALRTLNQTAKRSVNRITAATLLSFGHDAEISVRHDREWMTCKLEPPELALKGAGS